MFHHKTELPRQRFSSPTARVFERSSGISSRSLAGPAAKTADDPHGIADSDHTGDQPQQGAGGGIERQANAQAQRENQKGSNEDRHVQDDSQHEHAVTIPERFQWAAECGPPGYLYSVGRVAYTPVTAASADGCYDGA